MVAQGKKGIGGRSSLLNSLISYWTFDNLLVDSTGSGNTLTNTNGVTQAAGKIGRAASFVSASNQKLQVNSNAGLQSQGGSITIAAWVNLTDTATSYGIAGKSTSGSLDEWLLDYSSGLSQMRMRVSTDGTGGTLITTSTGTGNAGNWQFIVGWFDLVALTVNLQVNNGTVASAAVSGIFSGNGIFYIGDIIGSEPMNGLIDEVGFWKRTLSSGERTALYNSGNGITWPFIGV